MRAERLVLKRGEIMLIEQSVVASKLYIARSELKKALCATACLDVPLIVS